MNWVVVDSSVFASVAYRSDQHQLFLKFHTGKVYRYFEFPSEQYDELLALESKGRYFAESIRGKFLYEEVREAQGSAGSPARDCSMGRGLGRPHALPQNCSFEPRKYCQ